MDLELPLAEDGGHDIPIKERTVKAELTSDSSHTGVHRYTFPSTATATGGGSGDDDRSREYSILVDVCHTAMQDVEPLDMEGSKGEIRSGMELGPDGEVWTANGNKGKGTGSKGSLQFGDDKLSACVNASITVDQDAQSFSGWVDNAGGLSERSVNHSVRVYFHAVASASCDSNSTQSDSDAVTASALGTWENFELVSIPASSHSATAAPANRWVE